MERIRTLNGTIATLRAEIEELKKEKEANASASTQSGANEVALVRAFCV